MAGTDRTSAGTRGGKNLGAQSQTMANAVCPSCGKKQFNPSTKRCYACNVQQRPDGSLLTVPAGYVLDPNGNLRTPIVGKAAEGKFFVSFHYLLEPGKTTPRGEYPKLAEPPKCVHPERASCNHGEGFLRCEFMDHVGGAWACTAGNPKA